jgi:hypothetical protein
MSDLLCSSSGGGGGGGGGGDKRKGGKERTKRVHGEPLGCAADHDDVVGPVALATHLCLGASIEMLPYAKLDSRHRPSPPREFVMKAFTKDGTITIYAVNMLTNEKTYCVDFPTNHLDDRARDLARSAFRSTVKELIELKKRKLKKRKLGDALPCIAPTQATD